MRLFSRTYDDLMKEAQPNWGPFSTVMGIPIAKVEHMRHRASDVAFALNGSGKIKAVPVRDGPTSIPKVERK